MISGGLKLQCIAVSAVSSFFLNSQRIGDSPVTDVNNITLVQTVVCMLTWAWLAQHLPIGGATKRR